MYSSRVLGWLVAIAVIAVPLGIASAQTPLPPQPPAKRPPAAAPKDAAPKEAPRAAPAPAPAANPTTAGGVEEGPSATTAVYGDWVVRCSQQSGVRTCESAQTIFAQGQQNPIAVIAIGREKQGAPLRLVAQLPLNVTVPAQVKITLAPADPPLELIFEQCRPTSCFAVIQPADNAVRRLRAHPDVARISYKDATDQDVGFQFSLRGLAPALDALAKS